ncbi:alpha/beta hydrolase [Actinokineospora iranica]|uniref:Alpha/beta hydrolase fold n=1 Tax=Actinokineospora iranica TaxID=1271860 RepID=A0A1G6QYP3_9PSEU|nr:alpha/beta hydrolase [Actinokineospora iranica]SDC97104.1 alpha/beta hydrolase fold [Actinokineospora iranica]
MSRFRLVPLLALLVALLSACTVSVSGTAVIGTVEQVGPKGPVPAGLERFYSQPLTWSDCRAYIHDDESRTAFVKRDIRCARLTVPLDYANPGGREITIGVLRRQAAKARLGALVLNPGGPGGSGMSAAVSVATKAKRTELADRFDIVGFDPRGVGASEPRVRCLTGPEMDADRIDPPETTVADAEAENQDFAAKCAERTGVDVLANIGTRDVVRDMDVLRSALGEEKLTYLGYSYGTRIGTAYAEAFPGNVRAMVLDGAVDPLEDPAQQAIGQAQGFEKALADYFAWCAERPACVIKTKDDLRAKIDALETAPLSVGGRRLSASDATTGIAAALYSDDVWPVLSDALAGLAKGSGVTLMLLADLYLGRASDGEYSGSMDALIAVRCVDEPRLTDRAKLAEVATRVAEATKGSFLTDTDPPLPALDPCAFWPAPNTTEPHQPVVTGAPRLLVVSTTGDPATPHQAGVNLAKSLDARLLTYEATQHTAFLQGDECVDSVGIRYLVDLSLPAADMTCEG